jgi:FkbM family methyltransferase
MRRALECRQQRRHYGQFAQQGALAFDVGANVGTHTKVLVELGARVVAVEPNADLAPVIAQPGVEVVTAAVGAAPGEASLYLPDEHVLATVSERFAGEVRDTLGLETREVRVVPVTTLDALRDRYGTPAFVKLDVEGSEPAALEGMSFAPAGLSFEFHGRLLDELEACLDRLDSLDGYEYQVTRGNAFKPVTGWTGKSSEILGAAAGMAEGDPTLFADISCRRRQRA